MVKPMLAFRLQDKKKHVTFPVAIQPKYNGIRCIYYEGKFHSRDQKRWNDSVLAHLLPDLDHLNPAVPLDGELYLHGMSLQQINSAVAVSESSLPKLLPPSNTGSSTVSQPLPSNSAMPIYPASLFLKLVNSTSSPPLSLPLTKKSNTTTNSSDKVDLKVSWSVTFPPHTECSSTAAIKKIVGLISLKEKARLTQIFLALAWSKNTPSTGNPNPPAVPLSLKRPPAFPSAPGPDSNKNNANATGLLHPSASDSASSSTPIP